MMALRKRTLRRMQPFTRKLGKLLNEVDGVKRHLKNLIDEVQTMELKARALDNMNGEQQPYQHGEEPEPPYQHGEPCDDESCPCRKAEADDWRDHGAVRH